MAISATSSGLGTPSPQFLSFMQMNQDSTALKSSVKTARAVELNMQKESVKAAEDMKEFFTSIGKDIKTLVRKTTDSLGITTKMADIIEDDFELSEKLNEKLLYDQLIKDRDENIKASETKEDDEVKEKGPGILDSLKDTFKGLGDNQNVKDIAFIALLTTGVFVLAKAAEKLNKFIAPIIKFVVEKIIPGVKEFFTVLSKDIGPIFDNIGKFFLEAFDGVSDVVKSINDMDASLFLTGLKKLFFDLPIRFVSIVGDAVASIADAFLKALGIDAPWVEDIATAFRTLPEAIDRVITDTMKFFTDGFDKLGAAYSENGLIGAIGEGFRMFYDNTIALGLNLLYDIHGAIAKMLGMEKLGNFFQSADFSFDAIKSAITDVMDAIGDFFTRKFDSVKSILNAVLPKSMQIPLSDEVKNEEGNIVKKNNVALSQDVETTSDGVSKSNQFTTSTLPKEPPGLNSETIQQNNTTIQTRERVEVNNFMKEKNTELNKVAAINRVTTSSAPVTIISNKGATDASVTNQNAILSATPSVDSSDSTARDLLSQVS
jgi:hypothetical protein